MSTSIENKAYTLGIIARELGVDFDEQISKEDMLKIDEIAEDAISEDPKTELGKKIKSLVEEEKAKSDSEYNQSFNFNKDLNNNKIAPVTVFLFELIGKYAQRLVDKDETVINELLGDLIKKMNEIEYPIGYSENPFTTLTVNVNKINHSLKGQLMHRKDEIEALAVGIKHPKYNTLSPHIATFKNLDDAILKLREITGFTEADYRGE